ncbi:MAG: ATP-binding protein [Nitrospirota bacterium]
MIDNLFIITTFLFLLIFILIISFRAAKKGRTRITDRKPEIGFIVETFHELVDKLKKKERELEYLKKEAEERAERIKNYNEYILQSVPSGVISLDIEMRVTKMNAAAEKILSIKEADAIGKNYTKIFGDTLTAFIGNKATVRRGEMAYTSDAGKISRLGLTLTPLRNSGGDAIGQLLVFTDLTELKALESQAALRDRLSSLGEMAAGIAHELRNPMGVIAGYTKLLSKKPDTSLKPITDSISKEVSVMDRIITDFLSFARPPELNVSVFNLTDTLKTGISNVIMDRHDIKVNLSIPDMLNIEGDEILLRQAFINLFVNAAEAMPHGGILGIEARIIRDDKQEEPLSSGLHSEHLDIKVTDSGHGIPPNMLEKIFMPFYTTKDRGTGLGLAIVHKVITVHNGLVKAESSDNGTTIRIRLPLTIQRKAEG